METQIVIGQMNWTVNHPEVDYHAAHQLGQEQLAYIKEVYCRELEAIVSAMNLSHDLTIDQLDSEIQLSDLVQPTNWKLGLENKLRQDITNKLQQAMQRQVPEEKSITPFQHVVLFLKNSFGGSESQDNEEQPVANESDAITLISQFSRADKQQLQIWIKAATRLNSEKERWANRFSPFFTVNLLNVLNEGFEAQLQAIDQRFAACHNAHLLQAHLTLLDCFELRKEESLQLHLDALLDFFHWHQLLGLQMSAPALRQRYRNEVNNPTQVQRWMQAVDLEPTLQYFKKIALLTPANVAQIRSLIGSSTGTKPALYQFILILGQLELSPQQTQRVINQVAALERITNQQVEACLQTLYPELSEAEKNRLEAITASNTSPETAQAISETVEHAGCVLLHLFYPSLFKNLGLANEANEWQDEEAQLRAAQLILHLVLDEEVWNDEAIQNTLINLLVGLPHDTEIPLPADFELNPQEQSEFEQLLEVIHANWKIMEQATWTDLKIYFFNRTGTLHTKNNKLLLDLEPLTMDFMLAQKSWNATLVQSPWMDEMLHVNWDKKK